MVTGLSRVSQKDNFVQHLSIFSSREPKAQVNYCHSASSVVVRLSTLTFSTSSSESLYGF